MIKKTSRKAYKNFQILHDINKNEWETDRPTRIGKKNGQKQQRELQSDKLVPES